MVRYFQEETEMKMRVNGFPPMYRYETYEHPPPRRLLRIHLECFWTKTAERRNVNIASHSEDLRKRLYLGPRARDSHRNQILRIWTNRRRYDQFRTKHAGMLWTSRRPNAACRLCETGDHGIHSHSITRIRLFSRNLLRYRLFGRTDGLPPRQCRFPFALLSRCFPFFLFFLGFPSLFPFRSSLLCLFACDSRVSSPLRNLAIIFLLP